jgi:site-specific DNA-cytosine methylase
MPSLGLAARIVSCVGGSLRDGFDVLWSNDYEPDKHAMCRTHFQGDSGHEYVVGDVRAAIRGLNGAGYSVDMLALDARRFLPQSRPRMFLIGAKDPPGHAVGTSELRPDWADAFYADPALTMHKAGWRLRGNA